MGVKRLRGFVFGVDKEGVTPISARAALSSASASKAAPSFFPRWPASTAIALSARRERWVARQFASDLRRQQIQRQAAAASV